MSFCIVQTRKSKKAMPSLTAVPTNWVQDKSVYWPPNNLVSLSKNEQSVPDKKVWKKQDCKLVGRAQTYEQAEELIGMLDKITDSEDAIQMDRGTRAKPAKKRPKFQSKSYQLASPAIEPLHAPGLSGNATTDPSGFQRNPTNMTGHPPMQNKHPLDTAAVGLNVQLNNPSDVPNPVTHRTIQPMVTDPTLNVLKQSNLTVYDNAIDQVAMQEVPVFMSNDGKHYAKLDNGCYLEISNNQDTHDPQVAEDGRNSTTEHQFNPEVSMSMEFRKIHDRLDAIEGMMGQLMNFMANFEKFMQMKRKDDTLSPPCQQNEDFSDFEGLPRIDSDESLKALEQSLVNPPFADRYYRYFHTMFSLNGKRESAPFFRKVIRKLVTPVVFLPYSWKGNKRTKKSSSSETRKHASFESSFPEFIKFIYRLVHAADLSHTQEHNEKLFKDLLRYKYTEFKRFEQGYGDLRASSTRKRKQSNAPKNDDTEEIPHTSSKRQRSSSHDSECTGSAQESESLNGSEFSFEGEQ